MAKKDYIIIAEAIKLAAKLHSIPQQHAYAMAETIASVLLFHNGKFNRDKFMKACGVQNND